MSPRRSGQVEQRLLLENVSAATSTGQLLSTTSVIRGTSTTRTPGSAYQIWVVEEGCAGTEGTQQLGATAAFVQEARGRKNVGEQHDHYGIFVERHGAHYARGDTVRLIEFQRLVQAYNHRQRLLEEVYHSAWMASRGPRLLRLVIL